MLYTDKKFQPFSLERCQYSSQLYFSSKLLELFSIAQNSTNIPLAIYHIPFTRMTSTSPIVIGQKHDGVGQGMMNRDDVEQIRMGRIGLSWNKSEPYEWNCCGKDLGQGEL